MRARFTLPMVVVAAIAAGCVIKSTTTGEASDGGAADASTDAPETTSDHASATVGPDGGTVSSDGGVTITVPPGALAATTTVTIDGVSAAPAPSGATPVGPMYRFGPEGTQFAVPVTITLPFEPSTLPATRSASDVVIETSTAASPSFTALATKVLDATHVSARTSHFSLFAPFVSAAPSDAGLEAAACDANTSSDPLNCGACGAVCAADAGGSVTACVSGACRVVTTLATGQPPLSYLAVDATNAYFTDISANNAAAVHAVSLAGGAVRSLASGFPAEQQLVVSGNTIYWVASYSIQSVATMGGAATALYTPMLTAPLLRGLAVDDTNAYFAEQDGNATGTLFSVPLVGGNPAMLVPVSGSYGYNNGVAVDATSVYFVETSNGNGGVYMVPKAGGSVTALAKTLTRALPSLGIDSTSVYFATAGNGSDGAVWRAPKTGSSAAVKIASLQPTGLALDASGLYLSTSDGSVVRVDPSGVAPPVTLLDGQAPGITSIFGVTTDASYVYWLTTDGAVRRVNK